MTSSEDLSARKAQLSATKQALLAQRLQGRLGIAEPVSGPQPRPLAGPAPLSFAQQRLWFLHQWDAQNPVYNITLAVELRGPLDPALLARVLGGVVERHAILRTSYAVAGANSVQIIAAPAPWTLPLIDLCILAPAEGAAVLQQVLLAESRQPFDLGGGPVLRTTLLRLGRDRHVLIGTLHHIAADAWSVPLLLHEVAALYDAFAAGRPSSLPELPLQYADYAWWQHEWAQSAAYQRQLAYWKAQLRGPLPTLTLPTDRPRPPIQSYRGARLARTLTPTLAGALKRLSQAEDVTPFMTLLAGFQALLCRYTGQDDLLVGTSIANRNHAAIERLIGLFVNLLVLRTDLSGRPTFRELLGRVRKVVVDALAHQDLPFEQLVQDLQPQRDISRTPLFQVAFVFGNAPPRTEFGSLQLVPLDVDNRTAKFDLTLFVIDTGDSLRCEAEYNTDVFDATTLERLLRQYQVVLEAIVVQPERAVASLPLLTAAERQQLLVQWNDTRRTNPQPTTIHALFELQAERRPDATALVFDFRDTETRRHGDTETRRDQDSRVPAPDPRPLTPDPCCLTYAELNQRANQLAHYLQQFGIGPDALVGIYMDRSANMVISLLGVLKAGAAYVPLDPAFPLERVAFMLEDTQLSVLLTEAALAEHLPVGWTHVIDVDADWPLVALQPAQNPRAHVGGEHRAYVMYTSGSTGVPKGIDTCHRGVIRLLCGVDYITLDAQQTFLHLSPIAFDASTLELWGALLHGGSCVLLAERIPTAEALRAVLWPRRISTLWLTASLFNVLIDETPELFAGVRQLLVGGEALSVAHVRRALAALPATQLINGYGPTESTTFACCYRIPQTLDPALHAIPIGHPIGNTQVYILDATLAPVPLGVTGELYIGGAGLARGYLNRPDLTAERFVPNAWGSGVRDQGSGVIDRTPDPRSPTPDPWSRLYRTGDLARYRPDGAIEFVGRADTQVKLRGFRIELAEIEAVLAQHPTVRQAAVVASASVDGHKHLAAYVVPAETLNAERRTINGPEWSSSAFSVQRSALGGELRAFLHTRLPEYMIPATLVLLDALPLTATGKIDRQALPAADAAMPAQRAYAAPRSDAEQTLATIWSQVLGVEQVGIDDSFFELGGDSIRGIQLLAKAQEQGLAFSIHQLFQHPTIRSLAETLADDAPPARPQYEPFSQITAARSDLPDDIEDAYPPAMLQAGMLFHSENAPDASIYHDMFSYHLRLTSGAFDPPAFRNALQQLAARHGILRTSLDFHTLGEPLQLVHRAVRLPLVIEDVRGLDHAAQEQLIAAWRADEQRNPFDWSQAPLMRVRVHQRAEHEIQLTLSFHHAILDGWSVAMLLTELFQRYAFLVGAGPDIAGPLTLTFGDFVLLEQETLRSAEARQYWQHVIADASPIQLRLTTGTQATDAVAQSAVLVAQTQIAPEVGERLQALAREMGVPLRSVLLAAHLRVLSMLGGTTDVLTGLVVNGRPETTDGERVLGLFLNTVPFRLRLSGGTWAELVRATFGSEQALLPYRRYPIAQIQQLFGSRPLFETTFNFVHFHVYQKLHDTNSVAVLGSAQFERTNFALTVDCYLDPISALLQLRLSGSSALLDDALLGRLGAYYRRALELLASDPAGRYQAHDLLTDAERQQVLVAWNATATRFRDWGSGAGGAAVEASCLHTLIEAQAARTPGALAVRDADGQLTYAELNQRAAQLATRLRQLGVAPETVVGIQLPRTGSLVVALLAVLKAGAAYVPLDPVYPAERLAFMLEDSGAAVLITNSIYDLRFTIDDLEESQTSIVNLATDDLGRGDTPIVNRKSKIVNVDNLAYVIYTSGSTGVPKGVQISQRALVNCLLALQQQLQLTPQDVLLSVTTVAFDIAALELFLPLISGAQVVLAPSATTADGPELAALLDRCGATVMQATPATWRLLLDAGWAGRAGLLALCGGEALPRELAARLGACCRSLWNLYGPTETTIWSASYAIEPAAAQPMAAIVPIGRPIANTQIYVLNAQLQPVPPGVVGDLYIGGAGLARGYRGRPDLTAERFVPNPWGSGVRGQGSGGADRAPDPSTGRQGDKENSKLLVSLSPCLADRLYRTGDLARWRPDGALEFLGRSDQQIKLRGYRIELDEIAAVLSQHPAVRASVVLLREDVPGSPRLVAYVVQGSGFRDQGSGSEDKETSKQGDKEVPNVSLSASRTPNPEPRTLIPELRAFLQQRLPAYMLPSAFVLLDTLPLTPNGKVDRRALPPPALGRRASGQGFVAPRTAVEETLARIWASVLRREPISVHDNFFELGGDSFLSVQVVAKAKQAGLHLAPRLLFQHQTIARIAPLLDGLKPVPAEQGLVTGPLRLTPNQALSFETHDPDRHIWNLALLFEADQLLKPALLARVVGALLAHHDALRTCAIQEGAGWRQFIAPPELSPPVSLIDLSALPSPAQPPTITDVASALQRSFQLDKGPLLRVAAFDCGAGAPSRLLILIHHTACDYYSAAILWQDFLSATEQLRQGQPIRLPPKTTSISYYAERMQTYTQSGGLAAELDYWLAPARQRAPAIPKDFPDGVHIGASARMITESLSRAETDALQQLVADDTQLLELMLAALGQTCARWAGTSALLVDLEYHGRLTPFDDVDLSRTVGWINFLFPLLLELDGAVEPAAILQAVKAQLHAIPNHGIGYGMLRYLLDDPDVAARFRALPPAQILLNYRGIQRQRLWSDTPAFRPARQSVGVPHSLEVVRQHLFIIEIDIIEDRLWLQWTYSEQVHRPQTVTRLVQEFLAALRTLPVALPPPEIDQSADAPFVAPRTELEAVLAGIWAEALGLERVGVNDDFFDLGGHSLLVFQVISRVRRAVQLHLPMNSLQKSPTIARLAEYIELLRWARHTSDIDQDDANAIREEGEI